MVIMIIDHDPGDENPRPPFPTVGEIARCAGYRHPLGATSNPPAPSWIPPPHPRSRVDAYVHDGFVGEIIEVRNGAAIGYPPVPFVTKMRTPTGEIIRIDVGGMKVTSL